MFVTDAGTAEAASNIIHVNGAGGATTSAPGNSNQIVITAAAGPTPFAVLQEFDDFLGSNSTSPSQSKLSWQCNNQSTLLTNGTSNHPGIYISSTSGTQNGIYLGVTFNGTTPSPIVLGGGTTTISWVIDLPTLSNGTNSYDFYCGYGDALTLGTTSESFVSGLYFKYNHALNGGSWTINATSASTTTTVNTASVVTTAWTTLTIVSNANNSSASFFVNNVNVGTITTNLPTVAISPMCVNFKEAGTPPTFLIDLFYINIVLTNPRSI
jgi:hypothetical protein